MSVIGKHKAVLISNGIWLVCIAAALLAASLSGPSVENLLPFAAIVTIPAWISMAMSPLLRREWAQVVVIFVWLALAVFACLAIRFMPAALLFLCAPAIAALFEREKIVETTILSFILVVGLFYLEHSGNSLKLDLLDIDTKNWSINTTIAATVGLLLASFYSIASARSHIVDKEDIGILSAVPGGLIRITPENRVGMTSVFAATQLSMPEDPIDMHVTDIFPDQDRREDLMSMIQQTRENGHKVSRQFKIPQPGGYKMTEITAGSLETDDVLLHIYDSTAHEARIKSLNEAYEDAKKDVTGKSMFFAGVSHELRTPLNAIIGFSDMMRSRLFGPLPNKYAEYAELIHDSGQHMLDLIGDVLDMSKVEAGKYELTYNSFDAADVLRSSAKMLRPSADNAELMLDVEIHTEQGELLVEADRKALRQITLNLVSNAIKFSPRGGRVLLRGQIIDNFLRIGVEDNGVGMTSEELEKVGKPYVQTHSGQVSNARGSGLGLSLVKSLAQLHKGRFTIESDEGVGTMVEVYIPQHRQ